MIEKLISSLRDAGMVLWVEDGRIRGRMRDRGKIPLNVRLMADEPLRRGPRGRNHPPAGATR